MENHAACGSLYNSRAHVHSMSRKLHVKKKRCHLCLVPAGQLAITRYYYAGTDFFNCSESKMRSRNRMEAHEIWLCVCSACANFFFFFCATLKYDQPLPTCPNFLLCTNSWSCNWRHRHTHTPAVCHFPAKRKHLQIPRACNISSCWQEMSTCFPTIVTAAVRHRQHIAYQLYPHSDSTLGTSKNKRHYELVYKPSRKDTE